MYIYCASDNVDGEDDLLIDIESNLNNKDQAINDISAYSCGEYIANNSSKSSDNCSAVCFLKDFWWLIALFVVVIFGGIYLYKNKSSINDSFNDFSLKFVPYANGKIRPAYGYSMLVYEDKQLQQIFGSTYVTYQHIMNHKKKYDLWKNLFKYMGDSVKQKIPLMHLGGKTPVDLIYMNSPGYVSTAKFHAHLISKGFVFPHIEWNDPSINKETIMSDRYFTLIRQKKDFDMSVNSENCGNSLQYIFHLNNDMSFVNFCDNLNQDIMSSFFAMINAVFVNYKGINAQFSIPNPRLFFVINGSNDAAYAKYKNSNKQFSMILDFGAYNDDYCFNDMNAFKVIPHFVNTVGPHCLHAKEYFKKYPSQIFQGDIRHK